jgi:type IV pilus assembly protein PilV
VTAAPLGTAGTIDCSAPATLAQRDQCAWHVALLGASETKGGVQLGAMTGARGCISNPVAAMPRRVIVAVAWQGVSPTAAPGATACGLGTYGGDERFRRAMVASITIGCLQNDPTTGTCVTP